MARGTRVGDHGDDFFALGLGTGRRSMSLMLLTAALEANTATTVHVAIVDVVLALGNGDEVSGGLGAGVLCLFYLKNKNQ